MMVRAKKNHIFNTLFSTILNRDNMADIVRRLIPTAEKAFIPSNQKRKTISYSFDAMPIRRFSTSSQVSTMANSTTSQRAEPGMFSPRGVVLKRFSTYLAIFNLFKSRHRFKFFSSVFIKAFPRAEFYSLFRMLYRKCSTTDRTSFVNPPESFSPVSFSSTFRRTIAFRMVSSCFKCFSAFVTAILHQRTHFSHSIHVFRIPLIN